MGPIGNHMFLKINFNLRGCESHPRLAKKDFFPIPAQLLPVMSSCGSMLLASLVLSLWWSLVEGERDVAQR